MVVMTDKIDIKEKVLSENDRMAESLRQRFAARKTLCLNLVSSPGSGKTSLLEKTIPALEKELKMVLVAGDVQTENDANRLIAAGGTAVRPIVTKGACHLDARMVETALDGLPVENADVLFIENVGNLVCPSSYDLGEDAKVVIISVTEGDDKPLKYPGMFRRSSLMIINKIDLLAHCEFDMAKVRQNALQINGNLDIIETSCRTGQGLDQWYNWLRQKSASKKKGQS
jgi:hydrogenase nickel incorporation protein HypB